MPLETLTDVSMPADEWASQYYEHKVDSQRIVTMFKGANYEKLSKFLKSQDGARWASRSLGLGKGVGARGR